MFKRVCGRPQNECLCGSPVVAFYSKEFVSGFQVTASMFRPAGVDGLFAALVVFGVAAVALALERSLISAWTLVVNPEGLRE